MNGPRPAIGGFPYPGRTVADADEEARILAERMQQGLRERRRQQERR